MKNLLLLTALVSFAAAGTTMAENKTGETETKVENAAVPVSSTDGKRLPGRDCKLYEGGTRQHVFPQYEIGNTDRPECPPETTKSK